MGHASTPSPAMMMILPGKTMTLIGCKAAPTAWLPLPMCLYPELRHQAAQQEANLQTLQTAPLSA